MRLAEGGIGDRCILIWNFAVKSDLAFVISCFSIALAETHAQS